MRQCNFGRARKLVFKQLQIGGDILMLQECRHWKETKLGSSLVLTKEGCDCAIVLPYSWKQFILEHNHEERFSWVFLEGKFLVISAHFPVATEIKQWEQMVQQMNDLIMTMEPADIMCGVDLNICLLEAPMAVGPFNMWQPGQPCPKTDCKLVAARGVAWPGGRSYMATI